MKRIVLLGFVFCSFQMFLVGCVSKPAPPPKPEPTFTAIPAVTMRILTPGISSTLTATPTPSGEGDLFSKITLSSTNLHLKCDPQEVIIDVTVKSADIHSVVFFFRMKDKATGLVIPWSNVAMRPVGNGMFEYVLQPSAISHEARYWNAWVQYQFVGLNSDLQRLGQSLIFDQDLEYMPGCP